MEIKGYSRNIISYIVIFSHKTIDRAIYSSTNQLDTKDSLQLAMGISGTVRQLPALSGLRYGADCPRDYPGTCISTLQGLWLDINAAMSQAVCYNVWHSVNRECCRRVRGDAIYRQQDNRGLHAGMCGLLDSSLYAGARAMTFRWSSGMARSLLKTHARWEMPSSKKW